MPYARDTRLSRRALLRSGGTALAASGLATAGWSVRSLAAPSGDLVEVELVAKQRFQRILP